LQIFIAARGRIYCVACAGGNSGNARRNVAAEEVPAQIIGLLKKIVVQKEPIVRNVNIDAIGVGDKQSSKIF